MIKNISLGQYFPGDSIIHNFDPRLKLIITFAFITVLFLAQGVIAYGILLTFLIVCILLTKIRPGVILRGLRPLIILIIFTAVLNIFYVSTGTVLFEYGILKITNEGVSTAIFMTMRIIMLVTISFVFLSYTTSPTSLTDGLESLLSPLKKVKFPVHELAMMMTIALRFIPTLIDETNKITNAQKARGADFESGNVVRRAKALIPVLVPLFISAFRRADELATAMESRCYQGGQGRTRLKVLKAKGSDYWFFLLNTCIFSTAMVATYYLNVIELL